MHATFFWVIGLQRKIAPSHHVNPYHNATKLKRNKFSLKAGTYLEAFAFERIYQIINQITNTIHRCFQFDL